LVVTAQFSLGRNLVAGTWLSTPLPAEVRRAAALHMPGGGSVAAILSRAWVSRDLPYKIPVPRAMRG